MGNTINQRIKEIIEASGKTINSYAATVGVSQPTLKACVDGSNNPSFDTLQKILKGNPMISAEWLMRGVGEMLLHDQPQQRASFQKFNAEIEVGEAGYLKFKIKK